MEVRTFVRIQRVIWDHLLASKAEIIQKQQLATNVVETILGKDAFRYLSICSILFASSVNSLIPPPPPIQCCVGAVVCAVEEIEKSTLFWGEGGNCDQDAQKFNFITKCPNTFAAHCLQEKTCFC